MKKTVSLAEVIVGAIILVTVFGSFLAAFTGVRGYVRRANKRLVSANLARSALNRLYKEVRQDTWDSGALSVHTEDLPNYDIDGLAYNGGAVNNNYVVSSVDGRDYRKVDITIYYPED